MTISDGRQQIPAFAVFSDRIRKHQNEMRDILEETAQTAARKHAENGTGDTGFRQAVGRRTKRDAEAFAKIAVGAITEDRLVPGRFSEKESGWLNEAATNAAAEAISKFWEANSSDLLTETAIGTQRQRGLFGKAAGKIAHRIAESLHGRCGNLMFRRENVGEQER